MSMQEERKMILGMLAEGKISAQEAADLLEALAARSEQNRPAASGSNQTGHPAPEVQRAVETTKEQIREAVQQAQQEARRAYHEIRDQARQAARDAKQQARAVERHARRQMHQHHDGHPQGWLDTIFSNIDFSMGFDIFGNSYRFEDVHEGAFTDVDKVGMHVNTSNGRIEVIAWDEPKFKVVLRKTVRANSEEEARRKAEEMCTITNTGDHLIIDGRALTGGNSGLSVEAYLPKDRLYDFDLVSSNGRIALTDLNAGQLEARSSNGRITLERVNARQARVNTSNGSVSSTGDVDDLVAHTSNGSIAVNARVLRPTSLQLNTSNGSVRVRVHNADDLAHSLNLVTSMGSVRVDLPRQKSIIETEEKRRFVSTSQGFEDAARRLTVAARTSNGGIVVSPGAEL